MDEIRIDDLREPRRTAEQQRLYDFAFDVEVDIDPDALVQRARTVGDGPGRDGEIVGATLFLASAAASYITGHTLAVDGGYRVG
jgi:NAD(P)-dependent dehydrogenase (short-subunit alcohol dehydrogenase family)